MTATHEVKTDVAVAAVESAPADIVGRSAAAQVAGTVNSLAEATAAARAAFSALQDASTAADKADAAALVKAMNAGDAAIALERFAPARRKQSFLKAKTGAPISTIKLCVMLANGRARIEAEIANALAKPMTVRRARQLLSPPRAKPEKTPLETAWKKASTEERKALFAAIDFDEARTAFTPAYFKRLNQQFVDQLALSDATGKAIIDPDNPPGRILRARKMIRHAMAPDQPLNVIESAVRGARKIVAESGLTIDDLLHVPNPVKAGKKSARRRAA